MEKHQKVCASAFIFQNDKILILRRAKSESFMPGYWDVPGGGLEFGETPEEALRREAKEEANLKVKVIVLCNAFSYVRSEKMRHHVDMQYIAELVGDSEDIKLNEEHDDYRWISENELESNLRISEEMRDAIKKGFALRKILYR